MREARLFAEQKNREEAEEAHQWLLAEQRREEERLLSLQQQYALKKCAQVEREDSPCEALEKAESPPAPVIPC